MVGGCPCTGAGRAGYENHALCCYDGQWGGCEGLGEGGVFEEEGEGGDGLCGSGGVDLCLMRAGAGKVDGDGNMGCWGTRVREGWLKEAGKEGG